jgi:hypothetical protein
MTEKIEYKVNDPFGKPRPEGEDVITVVPGSPGAPDEFQGRTDQQTPT